MKGSTIVAEGFPKGHFDEGLISGSNIMPGTFMEIVPGTAAQGGRFTWRACTQTAGNVTPVAILREDDLQGKTVNDAYITGTRCFLYFPVPGEFLNARVDVPGTGTGSGATTIGETLEVNIGGHLTKSSGSPVGPTFTCLERLADVAAASELTLVQYNG